MPTPQGRSVPPWAEFEQVLAAARRGDPESLEVLFVRFYPRVSAMVHRSLATDIRIKRPWMCSLFSTGDVVQDVFKSVLHDLDSVASPNENAFVGYLAMVVRNRLIDSIRFYEAARRDGRRAGELDALEPTSPERGPSTRAISAEEFGLFHDALSGFPSREMTLLRERIEGGEKFQVLADRLGYPSADAARKAFYAAQAKLLLRLQRGGVSAPDEGE